MSKSFAFQCWNQMTTWPLCVFLSSGRPIWRPEVGLGIGSSWLSSEDRAAHVNEPVQHQPFKVGLGTCFSLGVSCLKYLKFYLANEHFSPCSANWHFALGRVSKIFSITKLLLLPKGILQTGQDFCLLSFVINLMWQVSQTKWSWKLQSCNFCLAIFLPTM